MELVTFCRETWSGVTGEGSPSGGDEFISREFLGEGTTLGGKGGAVRLIGAFPMTVAGDVVEVFGPLGCEPLLLTGDTSTKSPVADGVNTGVPFEIARARLGTGGGDPFFCPLIEETLGEADEGRDGGA